MFVRCDDVPTQRNEHSPPATRSATLFTSVMLMCHAWAHYGGTANSDSSRVKLNFIRAFFNCGSAKRPSAAIHLPEFPSHLELSSQFTSTRRTSKPRDFILAIMPQYTFYTVPKNAKSMTFAQLFVDCYRQLEDKNANLQIAPLIMDQLRIPLEMPSPTEELPEPIFLGDLLKLFYGPRLVATSSCIGSSPIGSNWGFRVEVELTTALSNSDIRLLIAQSFHMSCIVWQNALGGDLREFTSSPYSSFMEGTRLQQRKGNSAMEASLGSELRKAVEALWTIIAECRGRDLGSHAVIQCAGLEAVIRLAALISCGVGASAFEWSKRYLTPVLIRCRGQVYLGLAPTPILEEGGYEFFLLEADRYRATQKTTKRFSLVAQNPKIRPGSYNMCLFPPAIDRLEYVRK